MLRLALVVAFAVSSSVVTAAPSKAPKKKPEPTTMLLIWGGGPKPEDADKAAEHFKTAGFSSSAPLAKMFSTDVKGLKPGFHIAVLGACPGPGADGILRRARRSYGGVYLRRVPKNQEPIAKLACPSITTPRTQLYFEPEPNDEPVKAEDEEEVTSGKYTLHVLVTAEMRSNGEMMSASWDAVAELKEGGKSMDSTLVSVPSFAKVDSFDSEGDSVVIESLDTKSDCGTGNFLDAVHVTRTFRIVKGKIKVTEKVTSRESGLCPPSYEGHSNCEMGCLNERYQAVQSDCDGVTEQKCDEALRKYDAQAEPCSCDEAPADTGD